MPDYSLSAPNNPQPDDSADQQQPPMQNSVPVQPQQQAPAPQQNVVAQPQPAQPGDSATVTNAPHPAVEKASLFHNIAEALTGGPRYAERIDVNTGETKRERIPLSSRDIGMALAMEAITGAVSGLAQRGPGAEGRAAAAGFDTVAQQQRQAQQDQQQQAQQDANNQTQALTRKAAAFESAQRAVLNTAQAERWGVDSLKDAVTVNAPLLATYKDEGSVSESNVNQDDLMAGMKSGKYDPTAQIAVPDGFTNINGKYEQTFSIVNNPSAKIPLTSEQAKTFADAGVPGWQAFKASKVPDGYLIPGTMLANANAQLQAINLMKQDVSQVADAFAQSSDKATQQLAKEVPNFSDLLNDKDNGPAFRSALMKMQKYVTHSDQHGMNLYQSLQQMAQPSKPDPRNPKQSIPNPDANAPQTIAGAFGNGDPNKGWALLKTYSQLVTPQPIKNADEAVSIATDLTSSPAAVRRANAFLAKDTANNAAVVRAGAEAREAAKPTSASLTQPDVLGFSPTVSDSKEANKRFGTFKKNLDELGRTEQSYQQFQQALSYVPPPPPPPKAPPAPPPPPQPSQKR